MQSIVLFFLTAVVAVALAGGQYYVPRAYYTIDAEGHASAPVPLRRLRRALQPYPNLPRYQNSEAVANANANAYSGGYGDNTARATANANANANARPSGWGGYRSSGPDFRFH